MHRSLFRPPALLLGGLLFALIAGARPGPLQAQIPVADSAPLIVPTGSTKPLQMATKKAIKLVKNSNEKVLGIKTIPGDPTTIELTGQDAGITHLELTDVDGKTETVSITVQVDVEFLRIQLRRWFPKAELEPIAISNDIVVVRGTVNTAQEAAQLSQILLSISPGMHLFADVRVAGVQQVQLCVTVAQVSRTQLRRMAFDFIADSKNFFFGSTVGQAVAEPPLVGIGSTNLNVTQFGQVLSGVPGAPNGAPTNLLFGVIHNRYGFIGFLQALRDEGVVKEIAEPTVTTLSGRPASFLVGGEQAIPVPAGLGQVGVQFEEFGTRLNFVPIVLGNGKIHLEVEPEVSTLNAADGTTIQGTTVPGRSTTRVNTTVELEDGQTFVIGGLVEKAINGATEKTPILGDLPFLGAAFSSKIFNEEENEMVILVTPHLVDAEDCAQAPKILPGQETRRPDDFELFLEGILEAPRGPRKVFEDHHYVAPYKNSPTASQFPCAGRDGSNGACNAGCSTCGDATAAPALPVASGPVAPQATAAKPMPAGVDLKPMPGTAEKTKAAPAAEPTVNDVKAAPEPPAGEPAAPDALQPPPALMPPAAPEAAKQAPGASLPADLPPAVSGPGAGEPR